ncbi:MAG: glycosyltransferase family 4 protein [Pasteurellaceae bacterium]|nr:glycosyltransferase family 4 protein [Pasteurellaceae bacterium]
MINKTISISVNRFAKSGGMESYVLYLVRQLHNDNIVPIIYSTSFDKNLPEINLVIPKLINQKFIPKKLRAFLFTYQLQKQRKSNEYLISCHQSDHADLLICGGTHLGFLKNMGKKPSLIDNLIIKRNYSNYSSAKLIVAHSELMKSEIKDLYHIDENKIQVIYPPIDNSVFTPSGNIANIRHRYTISEEETIFLFPSTGHTRKGLNLLAEFFSKTDLPIKLAVVGAPLPHPIKNVLELGYCKNMPELYRAVDYTIMASLYEPFGLVGIESILCGTKVVLAKNMACCEVLNNESGFFFDRNNYDSLHDAINKAVNLKKQNKHKIENIQSALAYDPSMKQHMESLYTLLSKTENKQI